MKELNDLQMSHITGGEVTVAAMMALMVAAIVAVVIYRLFMSDKGSTTLPGGFKFSWD